MRLAERFLQSRHPAALRALIALTHGVFCFTGEGEDVLPPLMRDASEQDLLEDFLARPCSSAPPVVQLEVSSDPTALFRHCRWLGAEIARSGDAEQFRDALRALAGLSPVLRLIGICGLSHALFRPTADDHSISAELAVLDRLLGGASDRDGRVGKLTLI
jgi:hypothetical protein